MENLKENDAVHINTGAICEKVLDSLDVAVYCVDLERKITVWSHGASEILGFSKEEMLGKSCFSTVLSGQEESPHLIEMEIFPINYAILKGGITEKIIFLNHKDGYRVRLRAKGIPIYEGDKIVGAFEILKKDASEGVEIEDNWSEEKVKEYSVEDLKVLALYDALTGLPNRRYLESFLKSKIMEYGLLHLSFGILFMDIDNFSAFNNCYGHGLGDKVLQMVAASFANVTRKSDLIGRWGGEEFVAVFSMVSKLELEILAEKIRQLVETSVLQELGEKDCKVTISIGGTIFKENDDLLSIIERADAQMYLSKKQGKNRVNIF